MATNSTFSTSNNLFGGTSTQNQNSNNLFGSNTQNSGSLFGGGNTNNNKSSSLFGNNNNNSGSSLFGNTSSNNNSLFGNNNANSNSLFSTKKSNNNSLFSSNSNTNNSIFGNNTQNSNSLFGNNNQNSNQANKSLFAGNNNNNISLGNIPEAVFPWWLRELLFVQNAYSSGGSTLCSYMYDKVPEEIKIIALGAPDAYQNLKDERKNAFMKIYPWLDEQQWSLAEAKCPDGFLPTPVIGIKGLKERVESQVKELNDQETLLVASEQTINSSELSESWLDSLKHKCSTQLQASLIKCRKRQEDIDKRMLKIFGKVDLYIALVSGRKLSEEEAHFHDRILYLRETMGKLSESAISLRKLIENKQDNLEQRTSKESKLLHTCTLDDDRESELFAFFKNQKVAVEKLTDAVQNELLKYQA